MSGVIVMVKLRLLMHTTMGMSAENHVLGRLHSSATSHPLQLLACVGSYKAVLLLKCLFGQIDVSMVKCRNLPPVPIWVNDINQPV